MRTKRTVLNMIFSVLSLLISSLLSLLLTRFVLLYLGSDYNGLNGTVSQFLSVLMLFESGFTVAVLVRLYKPFSDENYDELNGLLSKAKLEFNRIAVLILLFGVISSAVYTAFIKTSVEYTIVFLMFFMSIASTAFNFYYTYKFRLMFQVSQCEYLVYATNIGQYMIMYSGMILIVRYTRNIVFARGFYLLMNIAGGIALSFIARNRFPRIRFDSDCSTVKIEGTKDLFVSKLVGILYNSLTPFYLVVFVGTLQTSVYIVFNAIISIVNNFVNTALMAPQNALGQIINSDSKYLRKTMEQYEYTAVMIASVLLATTMALIIPFIRFYTAQVKDVEYVRPSIAILLILISATQIIHIPSGKCIELSGKFKVIRQIQVITFAFLAVFSLAGAYYYGLIGLLFAKLLTNIVLAAIEIRYVHTKLIPGTLKNFTWLTIPSVFIASLLAFIEFRILFNKHLSIISFIVTGFIVMSVNAVVLVFLGYFLHRPLLQQIVARLFSVLRIQREGTK